MKLTAAIIALVLCCSCQSIYRPKGAIPTSLLSTPYTADLSQPTLFTSYEALQFGKEKIARRNQVLYELIWLTDQQYNSYEASFFSGQSYVGTAADAAVIGMSAAGSVVGAAQIKSILAAASGSVVGLNSSYQKNFFDQATRESIVQVMRSSRMTLLARIETGMTQSSGAYTLEDGLLDVGKYYDAGTITGALISISNSSAATTLAAGAVIQSLPPTVNQ